MNATLTLVELELYDPRARAGQSQRRFLCPFCGADKPRDAAHRSLSLNVQTGRWICHRCGERGLLTEFSATSQNRATQLAAMIGLYRNASRFPENSFDWQGAWEKSANLSNSPGAAYLQQRAISAALARLAGVRYSPRWYRRPAALFPIHDQAGNLVAVSGRFISERNFLKTMTGGTKSLGVFSTPGAWKSKVIAVVEGPMDALSLAFCHLPAVAMMGTSWPDWLLEAIASKQVLIATDADFAGDEVAERLIEVLAANAPHLSRLRPPIGKDWNDVLKQMGRKNMQDLIAER
ncbi:MAG: toprim domain-containing protein [Blastocatellales bacterium]